ncbi:hypothetical protein CJ030_MR3G001174 [Morella rubra]|uniref:Uncharacterized protein n=1 Tax=Morella rubra TaxID=262757 RepID=A0A6A1W376_9ROSI|nr:hypothetical protein CJ030_MR3G001174 [Morella rubra]
MEKARYPKVKVREQHDEEDRKGSSLLPLKDDSGFPVKKHKDISPPNVAKIPAYYVPNVLLSTISVTEGAGNNDNKFDDDDKISIRATPILRPRAVVSSPDNDVLIGTKNRSQVKQPSPLKNRHAQCKVFSRDIAESPVLTRNKAVDDWARTLRSNKWSAAAVPSQKGRVRPKRPSSCKDF